MRMTHTHTHTHKTRMTDTNKTRMTHTHTQDEDDTHTHTQDEDDTHTQDEDDAEDDTDHVAGPLEGLLDGVCQLAPGDQMSVCTWRLNFRKLTFSSGEKCNFSYFASHRFKIPVISLSDTAISR